MNECGLPICSHSMERATGALQRRSDVGARVALVPAGPPAVLVFDAVLVDCGVGATVAVAGIDVGDFDPPSRSPIARDVITAATASTAITSAAPAQSAGMDLRPEPKRPLRVSTMVSSAVPGAR